MVYLIINGLIITENEILEGYEILIEDSEIKKILPSGIIHKDEVKEVIDANGGYIAPGFIDIHSDYIELITSPRPTCLMNFSMSLIEAEKQLIAHGITTMFHSLSIYRGSEFIHKPIRNAENVEKLINEIDQSHNRQHLIRHRFHARFEIDMVDQVENLKRHIRDGKVHLVSFMDHTPGQGQYRDLEVFKKTVKGYSNKTDEEVAQIVHNYQAKEKITMDTIKEVTALAREKNIAVASHDDDTIEKLELVKTFGTTISEFPITLEVAKAAKENGFYTVAGAPNILLGGSHSGNLSAAEAIINNTIDILCSDYYPAAMLHSIFILHEKYNQDLCEMFKLVSINPAKAVNMDKLIGSIAEGKKADILIIEKMEEGFPTITSVLVDGKLTLKTNYRR